MMSFSRDPVIAEQEMHAVIYYLTAFGYIDGEFESAEKKFIQDYVAKLVVHRAREALGDEALAMRDVVERWTTHFHEVLDGVDHDIQTLFTESVADGEDTRQFVLAKLKLRCFELFRRFDDVGRQNLLATVDELMYADGRVHPNEEQFRQELYRLLHAPIELDVLDVQTVEAGDVVIGEAQKLEPAATDHPFFRGSEFDYARDPSAFAEQARGDMQLVARMMETLESQRTKGRGRLAAAGSSDFSAFAGADPFLDGHVYVLPPKPGKAYELLVLGDLHGCYSCLKAALLQADFFTKVQAHHDDPSRPEMKLVLLGDYIDRGRFSYNGILRTVMQLFVTVPDHVYALRGNHEYYVEINGRIMAPVRPCEAMSSIESLAPKEVFETYMRLFETLPCSLVFDKTLFVHAGIPREDTLHEKWKGIASLDDPEIRFQMLWSDPSEADAVPIELQQANARFPFGKKQFKAFMSRLGLRTLIRGHERVVEGFRKIYDDSDGTLLSLFSAGGATNDDLPESSNYREVTPMALTIRHRDGISELTPFPIDYERYNDPRYNAFFKERLSGTP